MPSRQISPTIYFGEIREPRPAYIRAKARRIAALSIRLAGLRTKVENNVRYANITIIEGHDASQYGIGNVSARIAEMVLRDERSAIQIGSYRAEFGVTLCLPTIVGSAGVVATLPPEISAEELETRRMAAGVSLASAAGASQDRGSEPSCCLVARVGSSCVATMC